MDWNAVVHMLDELRDEPRSLLDLPRAFSRYDRPSLLQNLLYLSNQDLISISESRYPHEAIHKSEWQRLLHQALNGQRSGSVESAAASVETSERGHRILELLGIGTL